MPDTIPITPQVTPGQTPGTTPPFQGTPDPSSQVNDMAKRLMQTLAQAAQRKQAAGQPVAAQVPGQQEANSTLGMNTANPHAWGAQRFMQNLGTTIKNAVAKNKERELLRAEGDWTYMQSSLNELYSAQASGNQQAVAAAQAKVDAIMSDPKKLKNMAKALNQDWLNPEKTTVYGEALKKVNAQTQQTDAKKGQAAQGIRSMFQKLLQQRQQPQLSPEQRQAMAREVEAKAPVSTGGDSVKDQLDVARTVEELAKATKELRASPDKYEVKPIKDETGGEKLVAYDPKDPTKPYIEIKSASGEVAKKGEKKYVDDGKLEIVAGIPTGRVKRGGAYVAPGQPGYTKEDKEAVDLGMKASGMSEQQKEKLARIRGESFAVARAANTPIPITNNETGEVGYATMLDVARNPGKYVAPAESEKIAAREAVHRSLNANFNALEKDYDNLPNGLDSKTQATIVAALHADDPGIFETLLVNKIKENAPDEVLKLITDLKVMHEDILVVRNVGGMGQGSESMRAAITRTVPGAGTSSVKEAKMQTKSARRTIESLFKGRPTANFPNNASEGDYPNVAIPSGWRWTTHDGKQGITDGTSFRPYEGKKN